MRFSLQCFRLKYLNLEQNNITSVPHLRLLEPNLLGENYSHTILPNFNEVIDEELQNVNSKISLLEEILYNGAKTEGLSRINGVIEKECSQGHLQGTKEIVFYFNHYLLAFINSSSSFSVSGWPLNTLVKNTLHNYFKSSHITSNFRGSTN